MEATQSSRNGVAPGGVNNMSDATAHPPPVRRYEASGYLKRRHGIECAPATLAKLACIGGGPAFYRAGRRPLYPLDELDKWAIARLGNLVRHTSQGRCGVSRASPQK
jgi:hypothetical protein